MKPTHTIILLSILLGVFFWVTDAALDQQNNQLTFLERLIYRIPEDNFRMRAAVFESFVLFGVVISVLRRRIDRALIKANEEYSRLIESATYGIFTTDEKGKFTLVNQAFADIFGYKKEVITERDLSILSGKNGIKNLIYAIAESKKTMHLELPCYNKKGVEIFVDVDFNPIRKGKQFIGIQGMAQNITEQNEMEMELRKTEREHMKMLEEGKI